MDGKLQVDQFKYAPLRDGCIRLLSVGGVDTNGILLCTLFDAVLDENLQFYAVSYAWRSDVKNQVLKCNGRELQVTESALEALEGLEGKNLGDKLPIWIDSICINQADDIEKAAQVIIMHKIFRRSKAVIVWLGPRADGSELAMAAIDDYAEGFRSLPGVPYSGRLLDYGLPAEKDPIWPALGCLFSRPWFFRLWTFQEIVLATTAVVHCGSATADWPEVEMLAYKVHQSRLWPLAMSDRTRNQQFRGFTSVANIAIKRRSFTFFNPPEPGHGPYLPFSRLLPLAQTKLCLDPRDRVYAMLSLTSQAFRDMVEVNYHSIDLVQLYIQCGKACLMQDPDLYYLQLVGLRSRRNDLPSWCVDLNPQELEMMFGPHLRAGLRGTDAEPERAQIIIAAGSNDIEVHGFRADTIGQILPIPFTWKHQNDPENARNILEWEKEQRLLACKTLGLPQDEIPIAHICTISANESPRSADVHTLTQAYRDQMANLASQASGGGNCMPPSERMEAFERFWMQMNQVCPGRTYFSTINGRVGIGLPYIQSGDRLVVIYGTKPIFVLREIATQGGRMEIIGNAFVHGLMDLKETPVDVIGQTEWFTIS